MIRLLVGLCLSLAFAAGSMDAHAQVCTNGVCTMTPIRNVARVVLPPYPMVRQTVAAGVQLVTPPYPQVAARMIANSNVRYTYRHYQYRCPHGVVISRSYAVPIQSTPEVVQSAAVQSVETQAVNNRLAFRRTLMEAARQALRTKQINLGQFLMIATASRSEKVLNHVEASLHEAAIAEGYATANGIDWDKLTEFFKNIDWQALLDFITKLITLFG